ncbi:aminopeptidase P family protein [Derxia gummosa]|uniref:Aminopeptidase P family protein n=1 Tax=Derxia gummosa DSM 723 TaxID=1121388 RepID=A0A8B6X5Z8_9BURK|nr:aminopeptidase P family protein [Derxia gummosa]
MNPSSPRLDALRARLAASGIDAVVLPSSDPHLSEYLPAHWQGRAWMSGFTGSMGTAVVTRDTAGVWADSRYWVQAEAELAGGGFSLMKIGTPADPGHADWLAAHLPAGATVAVDGDVLGLAAARQLAATLEAKGIRLRTDLDLLAAVWPDRPALPAAPVYEHERAPVSRAAKLAGVREAMAREGADWHWLSTLDDIAWLFNLRGSDVEFNPVFLSHALVGKSGATLFVGEGKVDADLSARLAADGVALAPYETARGALAALPADARVLIDPRRLTYGFRQAIPEGATVIEAVNPSVFAKSRKTPEEMALLRETMAHDGAALAEFFAWFEAAMARGERITELTIDEQATAARARRPGYVSLSFATIAGFNANGAMPHYRATEAAHAVIAGDGLLLIDSGGQYAGGTTDITRVVPVGTPSAEQKRDFTVVLKGLIALSRARFPVGIRAPMLDAIARAPMWAEGVDYGHGTGHGVGWFLNVHEGPQSISFRGAAEPFTAMQAGMLTSIEPGVYRPGKWGVRLENLVLCQPDGASEFGEFLRFEAATLCPIDTRCVVVEMLTAVERDWLDAYHAEVRARVGPLVEGAAREWLERRTVAL